MRIRFLRSGVISRLSFSCMYVTRAASGNGAIAGPRSENQLAINWPFHLIVTSPEISRANFIAI